jgi:hypothetical protein
MDNRECYAIPKRFELVDEGDILFANSVAAQIDAIQAYRRTPRSMFRFRSAATPYFTEELERALQDCEFYHPSAEQMNDPFDSRPIFETSTTFREFCEGVFPITWTSAVYNHTALYEIGKLSKEDLAAWYFQLNQPSEDYVKTVYESARENAERLVDIFFRKPRVLSLTGTHDNHMLWSMYGDRHAGVCYEIAGLDRPVGFKHDDSMGHRMRPVEVIYQDERPIVDLIGLNLMLIQPEVRCLRILPRFARSTVFENLHQLNYIRTKNTAWSHENEYRMIIHGHESGNYFSLSAAKVLRVYLGMNASAQTEKTVRQKVKKLRPHVEILRGRITEQGHGLSFDLLT